MLTVIKNKDKSTNNPYRAAHIADRFNFFGTINGLIDNILNLAVHASTVVNEFWLHTVPFYVTAIYYLIPALLPFVFITKDYCMEKANDDHHDELKDAEELLKSLSNIAAFNHFLQKHPNLKIELASKIKNFQLSKNITIDIVINSIYCSIRAFHGALIFTQIDELNSDKANYWLNITSTVVSVLYVSAMLIHKHFHLKELEKTKTGLRKYNLKFFQAAHAFMSVKKSQKELESISVFNNKPTEVDTLSTPLLQMGIIK